MKVSSRKSFEQCCNRQALVDDSHQVIVAAHLSQKSNDMNEVEPILDAVGQNLGEIPAGMAVSTDAGYFFESNVMLSEDALLKPYIATGRLKHGEVFPAVRGRPPPKGLTAKQAMARKLLTKQGQAIYSKRKSTVEPVFGQIKQARGLRQFLLRGRENVSAEWCIWCLTHNILKLHRYGSPSDPLKGSSFGFDDINRGFVASFRLLRGGVLNSMTLREATRSCADLLLPTDS